MTPAPPVFIKGMAGKLASFRLKIVSSCPLGRNAQAPDGPQDHFTLPGRVVVLAARDQAEVQVAQVMVYRAAPGEPARQISAVRIQPVHPAFLPGVLVLPDHHGIPVLPEEQDAFALPDMPGQDMLQRQILIGYDVVRPDRLNRRNHTESPVCAPL